MNSITTFKPETDPRQRCVYSVRPGWLVRLAPLGRLAGEAVTLVGIAQDIDADAGEAGIRYGIASDAAVSTVEVGIGRTLAQAFDEGLTVLGTVNVTPGPRRLTWLAPIPPAGEVITIETIPDWALARLDSTDPRLRRIEQLKTQTAFRDDFARRRELAQGQRKRWNFIEAKTRNEFATWIPEFARELLRENSRAWLELPNGTAPASPAIPPPLLIAAR